MPRSCNNSREDWNKIPDGERCCAIVELHKETTIQGWRINEPGRCLKKGKIVLTNKEGGDKLFCGTHKRMALEGKVSGTAVTMSKAHRSDCYMHDIPFFHLGEWSEKTPKE
jgi:hypothetical protein